MQQNVQTAFIGKKNSDWDYVFAIKELDAIHLNKKFYGTNLMYSIWNAGFPIRFYNVNGNENISKTHMNLSLAGLLIIRKKY